MTALIKNIIVVAGIVIVGALGYYLFFLNQSSTLNTSLGGLVEEDVGAQDFLNELSAISQIELTTEVFTDKRFTSLKDNSSEVTKVSAGRSTPFSPR